MRQSPLLNRPGAVPNAVGDPDEPVPAHYGDPLREQRLLVGGAAVTALARDVVVVSGPDRLSWLTTLSSQVLTGLVPGDGGVETLILDAHGHIAHALAALDDGRTLRLVTEAGRGAALAEHLQRMRFMLRVEVVAAGDLAVLAAMGGGADALDGAARRVRLARLGGGAGSDPAGPDAADPDAADRGGPGAWRDPWPGVVPGGTSYDVGLARAHPGAFWRAGLVIVPVDAVGEVVDDFLADGPGRALAGSLAWEALRIEAGRPRWAREVDERTIPHELDWLRTAVHLAKGCYPGQETIARTLNLGRPPRRLTILQLDGLTGRLPAPGAVVRLGERAVGSVTSVARHHELGPMALALLRRSAPVDAALTVDAAEEAGPGSAGAGPGGGSGAAARVDAVQEPLVCPDGKAQASPAQRPGAGLRKSLLH